MKPAISQSFIPQSVKTIADALLFVSVGAAWLAVVYIVGELVA